MNSEPMDRRRFLQTALLGSTVAITATALPENASGALTKPPRPPDDGLKLGIASYTYRKFPLDKAMEWTRQAGLKYINLKEVHLPLDSSAEERAAVRQKVQAAGLSLMGGGIIYLNNDEARIRNAFDYAKQSGMPTIVCAPVPEALDTVEKMAKEYQILIAIHNHGASDKSYPSPMDVYRLVKDRDPLMGICMDVGHTAEIGADPVECLEQCGSRMHDLHIKDISQPAPKGKTVPVGRGVLDIVGLLKALVQRQFPYHVGLEYEAQENDPQPGVLESVGYMRGALAAI